MQLHEGKIKTWKEDKGFGFIYPNNGGKDVFIHIRDLKHSNYKPRQGDCVCYQTVTDANGKTRAYDAFIKGVELTETYRKKTFKNLRPQQKNNREYLFGTIPILMLAAIPFIFSIILIIQHRNFIPFFAYLLSSLLIFFIYAIDKTKAHKNEWRVSEKTLHILEFLGGWPGALITQRAIRHKNKKTSFQIVFRLIIAIHLAVWTYILVFNNLLQHILSSY